MESHPFIVDPSCNAVEQAFRKGPQDARPTVVSVVYSLKTEELLLITPKKSDPPSLKFVQGGIDPGETAIQAGRRELREEVGLGGVVAAHGLHAAGDAVLRGGKSRDGFKDKVYWPLLFLVQARTALRLDRKEVQSASWIKPKEAGPLILRGVRANIVADRAAGKTGPRVDRHPESDPVYQIWQRFMAREDHLARR